MKGLRTLIPSPALSVALLLVFVLIARPVNLGSVLIGVVLALVIPLMNTRLRGAAATRVRPILIARYIWLVICDVVRSNIIVASDVLRWQWKRPRSQFVIVPLELRHPLGLAVLAMVTTVVPGTVWSELASDQSALLLHVWDVGNDEGAFIAEYRERYERPLLEIFA